jgi:hypothetical protein
LGLGLLWYLCLCPAELEDDGSGSELGGGGMGSEVVSRLNPRVIPEWSEDVSPLTLSPSAALMRPVSWASGTEVSPLYMKSTMHCTSHPLTSLSTMMGCLQGLSMNIFWKYGLKGKRKFDDV